MSNNNEHYLKALRGIELFTVLLYEFEGKSYLPFGTGVLLTLNDEYFILTASHVAGDNRRLFVNTVTGISEIYGLRDFTAIEHPQQKYVDVGYMELSHHLASTLQRTKLFLTMEMVVKNDLQQNKLESRYPIAGYIAAENHAVPMNSENVSTIFGSLILSPIPNFEKVCRYYKLYAKENIALQLMGEAPEMISQRDKKTPDLNGMSGSGIWYLYYDEKYKILNFYLIGIFSEVRKGKFHCAIGTHIEVLINRILNYQLAKAAKKTFKAHPDQ